MTVFQFGPPSPTPADYLGSPRLARPRVFSGELLDLSWRATSPHAIDDLRGSDHVRVGLASHDIHRQRFSELRETVHE